jgi:hypothetical protein
MWGLAYVLPGLVQFGLLETWLVQLYRVIQYETSGKLHSSLAVATVHGLSFFLDRYGEVFFLDRVMKRVLTDGPRGLRRDLNMAKWCHREEQCQAKLIIQTCCVMNVDDDCNRGARTVVVMSY